jgi:hypothetical protein
LSQFWGTITPIEDGGDKIIGVLYDDDDDEDVDEDDIKDLLEAYGAELLKEIYGGINPEFFLRLAARGLPSLRHRLAAHRRFVARRGHRPAREGLVFEPPRPDVQFLLVDRSSRSLSCDTLR